MTMPSRGGRSIGFVKSAPSVHRCAAGSERAFELAQRAAVAIDRDHFAAGSDELCEGEREGAGAGAEVGPRPAGGDAVTQEAHVIGVVH